MESVRVKEKITQKKNENINGTEVNEGGNSLRTCELLINCFIAVSLFYVIFCVRDLQKKVDILAVENCKLRNDLDQLKESYGYYSGNNLNNNFNANRQEISTYFRRLHKREIRGEKTLKQLTDDNRLVKEIEDQNENNTVIAITEPNPDGGSETERPLESENHKPKLRSSVLVPIMIPPARHSATNSGHGRKAVKEKPLQKKFAAVMSEKPEHKHREYVEKAFKPVAVHYSASLSNHSLRHHPLHKGNGLVTLPSPLYQYWIPISWIHDLNMTENFNLEGSDIKVNKKGLYFLYAQIQYTTKKDHNGYKVYRNSEPIAQCIFTKTFDHPEPSIQTCSLTTVVALSPDDKIFIQDISHNPTVALSPEKSFFGLVLIAPT